MSALQERLWRAELEWSTHPLNDGDLSGAAEEIDRLRSELHETEVEAEQAERVAFDHGHQTGLAEGIQQSDAERDRLRADLAETAACLEWARSADVATLRGLVAYVALAAPAKDWLDRITACLAKAKQEGGKL